MANKWSFLLSLIFVIQLLLMTGDLATVQVYQTQMQAFATTVGQRISLEGGMTPAVMNWANATGYTLECLQQCQPQFGDTLTYQVSRSFDPLIISDTPLTLRIVRHAVIGMYY